MPGRPTNLNMAASTCTSVDSSFTSASSSESNGYQIESEMGREALKEICCSILSRILDFPDGQLETLLGFEETGRKGDGGVNVAKNITVGLQFMKKGLSAISHMHSVPGVATKSGSVVSQTLALGAPMTNESQISLLQIITHMHSYLTLEGLFRKPGNKTRIEQLIVEFGTNGFDGTIGKVNYTGHDYASVLKQFLSELPEPLFVERNLDAYLQASALSSISSKTRCIQLLVLLLPPPHRIILQHLLDLFSQLTRSSQSKMDALNLALIFAPTLFLASKSELRSAASLSSLSSLLKFMIENMEEIFEVPVEVQAVAERYCRKKRSCKINGTGGHGFKEGGNSSSSEGGSGDIVMDMYITCCKRECIEDFHKEGQERAAAEVAQLMKFIHSMPDGPQKLHFMKRVESAKKLPGTPLRCGSASRIKHGLSFKRTKENVIAQGNAKCHSVANVLKPCLKKGSLIPDFDKVDCTMSPRCTSLSKLSLKEKNTPSIKRVRITATKYSTVTDV